MGRPACNASSNNNNNNNTNNNNSNSDFGWTPPLWLTGEKQPTRKRQFSFPIPPVPPETYKAIQQKVSQEMPISSTGRQPFSAELKQIHQLTEKLTEQKRRMKTMQEKVQALEQKKEEGLRDIRQLRQEETSKALEAMEKEMRLKHEQEIKEKKVKWRNDIEQEYNRKRKQMEEEQEAAKKAAQEDDDDGPSPKIPKHASSSSSSSNNNDSSKSAAPSEKKSDLKKRELQELQNSVESLQEKRSEMVWLLKQIIQVEAKQKAKSSSSSSSTTATDHHHKKQPMVEGKIPTTSTKQA